MEVNFMKQSTKLLSIVLALVMCFGCFSVVGNAALVKSEVQYDSIDNAALSAEQVADIALDLVDGLLADANIKEDLIGILTLDLTTLDKAADTLNTIADTLDIFLIGPILKAALGDAGDLNFNAVDGLKRSGGDIHFAVQLLKFLDDNRSIVKKAVNGIGTSNGLSLGVVDSFVDLGDINMYLGNNLKPMVLGLVYDALMYASYNMDKKWDDMSSKPYSSLDAMANDALYRLLTVPQDYTWEGTGDNATKVWDMNSIVSKKFAALPAADAKAMINVNNNSLLTVLDNILQIALEEFGLPAINSALKKVLMDAMGVDFVEITDEVPAEVMEAFEAVDPSTYINYLVKDYFFNVDGTYYYCDMSTRTVTGADGEPVVDEETGKELKEEVRKFYKAVAGTGNDMYDLVNWDYEFTADSLVNEAGETVTTQQLTAEYGSIFGCLNHLLYIILKEVINPDVDVDDIFMDGGNDMLNENIANVARWAVIEYTKDIFGKNSPYVDEEGYATEDFVNLIEDPDNDIIDLIAYIGLPFFEDAMPQLIMPKDADGAYNFGTEDQVLKFGAIVIREFITDITPAVNYDSYIFQAGSLTSATGRQFADHTQDEWVNLILNMGLDIAYTYLSGITNFVGTIPAIGITRDRWLGMLDAIVTWGANYIGSGTSSTLKGFEPNTIDSKGDAFDKLDYALNTLLPLGFISDCSGNGYAFSFETLVNKIIAFATDFDVAGVLSLIGRGAGINPETGEPYYNFLKDKNVLTAVLDLVNQILALVFGANILPNTTTADAVLEISNLQTTVDNLLHNLYLRGSNILNGLLPVLAQFIEDWGGEQKIGTPVISLVDTYTCANGALGNTDVTVSNGSKGVWRGYYDAAGVHHQDNQYAYKLIGVSAYNADGTASSYVTINSFTNTKIDFGQTGTINFKAANVPASGALARIVATYLVYDEDGAEMADGMTFTVEKYIFLSYNGTDANVEQVCTTKRDLEPYIYSPFYVGYQNAASVLPNTRTYRLKNTNGTSKRTGSVVVTSTATQKGITLNSWGKTVKDGSISVAKDSSEYYNGFTVNEATANAQTWTSGETLTWTVEGYGFAGTGSGKDSGTKNIIVHFYDAENLSKLQSLFEKEADKIRLATGYNTTGTVAANTLIDATPNDEGLVETAFTATTTDEDGETVTLIDRAQAWTNYMNAFTAAAQGARQVWNANSIYNFEALYKALYTASKDVEYLKMTAEESAAAAGGSANIEADVVALEALAKGYSDAMGGYGYTDYRPYRWDRFTAARNDVNSIINKYYAAKPVAADDEYFTYTDISETDLRELVAGNQYHDYIVALLEKYDADQMKAREVALEKAKENFTNVKKIDVSQAENLLTRNYQRLLRVTTGNAEKYYIDAEIASAIAIYGTVNQKTIIVEEKEVTVPKYTDRSWARYENALAAAQAAAATDANVAQFNAKYELQVAVNNLRTEDEEADYTELEALMAQAEAVLANAADYENVNKDFGKVLAALGMDAITNAKGDDVQLFPDAALRVNENSYDSEDQKKVDRAADALRAALAKMKFKNVTVPTAGTDVIGKDAKDEDIVVSTSHIKPLKTAQAVIDFFKDVSNDIKVSVNGTYAIEMDDTAVLTGTGSTVTFYKELAGGVKVPMATVVVVVNGDVNGDGAVDALDLVTVELTSNAHASLSGIFKVAGNLDTANEEIDAADYGAVANVALTDFSESAVA